MSGKMTPELIVVNFTLFYRWMFDEKFPQPDSELISRLWRMRRSKADVRFPPMLEIKARIALDRLIEPLNKELIGGTEKLIEHCMAWSAQQGARRSGQGIDTKYHRQLVERVKVYQALYQFLFPSSRIV